MTRRVVQFPGERQRLQTVQPDGKVWADELLIRQVEKIIASKEKCRFLEESHLKPR